MTRRAAQMRLIVTSEPPKGWQVSAFEHLIRSTYDQLDDDREPIKVQAQVGKPVGEIEGE